ncbi:zinc ribbon domain-containing protein [Faecalitalea cylindroides]|uniref:zinc ribbon domain-containing protein n=1 Tax=Faecalitalea cylindroides TaxID=39483 RepID=UPI003996B95D
MALINCPECSKEISDRAITCPNCGYPISEHLKQEELKKIQEQELLKKQKLKQLMNEKYTFNFFGKKIKLNKTEVFCSILQNHIRISRDNVDAHILDLIEPKEMLQFTDRELSILVKNNYSKIIEECTKVVDILNKVLFTYSKKESEVSFDKLSIEEVVRFKDYSRRINDGFYQIQKEQRTLEDEMDKRTNDVISTYQNGNIIDSVYSSSVGGLIGQTIKAKMINSVSNAFSHSKMRKELKKIEDQRDWIYVEISERMYKVFSKNSKKLMVSIFEKLVTDLFEMGILDNYVNYPKKESSLEDLEKYLDDQTILQKNKTTKLYKEINNNPADKYIYQLCVKYLVFNDEDVRDFVKLAEFVFVKDFLLGENNKIKFQRDHSNCSLLTVDNQKFTSLQEKEKYIVDKFRFESVINNFKKERQWYDYEKVLSNYQKIMELGDPKSDIYKEQFKTVEGMKNILLQYQTGFIKDLLKALQQIISDYTVEELIKKQLIGFKEEDFNLLPGEVPIKYYKYGSINYLNEYSNKNGLLITNMRMALTYVCNGEIFYSFYPTGEYVTEFVSTDNFALWASPFMIKFNKSIEYKENPKDKNSFRAHSSEFYLNTGTIRRKIHDGNVIEDLTNFFNIIQSECLNGDNHFFVQDKISYGNEYIYSEIESEEKEKSFKYCIYCGKKISRNAKYCNYCGKQTMK